MLRKPLLVLLAILLLGFILRVYRVTEQSMYGDELTMVYDSYSILKTGMDATGERLPLTFKMGAGRPGGYIYASVPFVALFGPSELGVRSLSLLSGLGIITLMYFLGKKIFGERVGHIAAVLSAVSPWDIYLSRGGFEAHFALFLVLFGVTAFLYGRYLVWAAAWGVALHTYPTFKLTLPLFLPVLLWFRADLRKIVKDRVFLAGVVLLTIFAGLAVSQTLAGRSEDRFLSINIFANQDLREQIIQRINQERSLSVLPDSIDPLFYNKPLEYSRVLLENYTDSLSPRFLFLRGDGNPRHNPGEWGMLYLTELPLLLIAIGFLWKDKKVLGFLMGWILIIPLASMLLDPGTGTGHALRNGAMLPALILLSAFAISKLPIKIRMIVIVLILIQLVIILQRVYFLAPAKFVDFWSAPAKEASLTAIKKSIGKNPVILLTNIDNIEYAYPVYAKLDPQLVISQYGKNPKVYDSVVIMDK